MAPRLKVFITSDGLTDYVVATSSRAKALAAWGVRQDLFAEGKAREVDDAALRDAALAQPDQVLRRPSGDRDALARLKPVARPKPKAPSKAALRKVADLEARLAAAQALESNTLAAIAKARQILDAAEETLAEAQGARERLEAALAKAREALD